MNLKHKLISALEDKKACIGVIGLGYVGLPLSLAFASSGLKVIGFDIDKGKVNSINSGKSYFHHIKDETIEKFHSNGLLIATDDFAYSSKVDALIICVPTPLTLYREPDLSFVKDTINTLSTYLRPGQIISLESTTYPGTTDLEIRPVIEKKGLVIGEDFFLVYSPEREDPGNKQFKTADIPKVVGGTTANCLDVGKVLYQGTISEIVTVSNTSTAEMTKLLENIHRAVNIGLMNELKPLADKMGIDLYEVIEAAATKPFGFVPYYPGPGLGGHCIPIDPFYLTWRAKSFGMSTRFIELAGEINTSMPAYVVEKVSCSLNDRGKAIKGSKILILGISYKKNVDDLRESPAVEIIQLLRNKGGKVDYSDPYFPSFPKMRKYDISLKSINLNTTNLINYDAIIIATDHDIFDYEMIKNNSNLIIDTRGRLKPSDKIIRA